MLFLGLDPGGSGGLCCIEGDANEARVRALVSMPDTKEDIYDWVLTWTTVDPVEWVRGGIYAVVEQVGGYVRRSDDPESKHGGQPGSAMFKFGENYGALQMALIAAGLKRDKDWHTIAPQVWQRRMEISPRSKRTGEKRGQYKNRLKAAAMDLFPGQKMTLNTCDAVLLAEMCRRHYMGIK